MKIFILLCLILVHFQSNQCGVVKKIVETVANEVNKVAGYIENGSNENGTLQDKTIVINTNATQEENTQISSKVIYELQNSTNTNKKNNTTIQVNVDINLVVNYNIPNTKQNESIDINKDASTNNPLNTVTEPSFNIEQSSIKFTAIDVEKTNTNIKFPGPMNSPIITYNDGVVVVEKNTTDERVLFPDSKTASTPGCPNGTFLTENGYCLLDNQREKESRNNDAISRAAFSAGCLHGFARALDGSCQQIID